MGPPSDRPPTADPGSLTRFQRMLLGTDGTVTHLLEAYADEPVEVVKLLQAFHTADDDAADLHLSPDDKVLRRQILLRGRRSRQNLLYAEAVVAAGRVEAAFLDGLLETDEPIGVLLAHARTETFREILRVAREPAGPLGPHFGLDTATELIWRTYRIVCGGRPVILITEKFPPHLFRAVPI
ncbi:MAG: chorismate--pyruvate lyase family protein [Acidimicrobiales bacterium]